MKWASNSRGFLSVFFRHEVHHFQSWWRNNHDIRKHLVVTGEKLTLEVSALRVPFFVLKKYSCGQADKGHPENTHSIWTFHCCVFTKILIFLLWSILVLTAPHQSMSETCRSPLYMFSMLAWGNEEIIHFWQCFVTVKLAICSYMQ